jgi:GR25 family glycosyltransferase involved in LPS biosynthesis
VSELTVVKLNVSNSVKSAVGRCEVSLMNPEIYLINLDRSTERLAGFRERNAHLGDFTRFSAVEGSVVDRAQLVADGVMLEDCQYGDGTLGCALSHLALWKTAIEAGKPITVFEDDVKTPPDFLETSQRLLGEIGGEWDVILWGYSYERPILKILTDFGFGKATTYFFEVDPAKFHSYTGNRSLFRLLNAFGLTAYSISPSGAKRLMEACLPLRSRVIPFVEPDMAFWDEGIDGPVNLAYPDVNAFVCMPPLAIQNDPLAPSARIEVDG